MAIICSKCGEPYPETGTPFRCLACGGPYDLGGPLIFDPGQIDRSQPGIWKYRASFPGFEVVQHVSLGEGATPLLWVGVPGRSVALKCEYASPTGSFKDRGTATLVAFLKSRAVTSAVEDSSGNAGASFAAYAARAGVKAQIYVPESASGPKREQISMYGAELVRVPGTRAAATAAALQVATAGRAYASHAWLPFNLPGYATAAYELADQMAGQIGTVVVPAGQGGLLLGLVRGFEALVHANILSRVPKIIGVQAEACAPLAAAAVGRLSAFEGASTVAEGVCVSEPVRRTAVVKAVLDSGGKFALVPEAEILPARDELAKRGFYVEPTSALVWAALMKMPAGQDDPVVAILTGSGYKVRG